MKKDGACSFVGALLAVGILIGNVVHKTNPSFWWFDAAVAGKIESASNVCNATNVFLPRLFDFLFMLPTPTPADAVTLAVVLLVAGVITLQKNAAAGHSWWTRHFWITPTANLSAKRRASLSERMVEVSSVNPAYTGSAKQDSNLAAATADDEDVVFQRGRRSSLI